MPPKRRPLLRVVHEARVLPWAHQTERVMFASSAPRTATRSRSRPRRFRGDLFERLREFMLRVPPLESERDLYPLTSRSDARRKADAQFHYIQLALDHTLAYTARVGERHSPQRCDGKWRRAGLQHLPRRHSPGCAHDAPRHPCQCIDRRLPERSGERTLNAPPTDTRSRSAPPSGNVRKWAASSARGMQVHPGARLQIDVDATGVMALRR